MKLDTAMTKDEFDARMAMASLRTSYVLVRGFPHEPRSQEVRDSVAKKLRALRSEDRLSAANFWRDCRDAAETTGSEVAFAKLVLRTSEDRATLH